MQDKLLSKKLSILYKKSFCFQFFPNYQTERMCFRKKVFAVILGPAALVTLYISKFWPWELHIRDCTDTRTKVSMLSLCAFKVFSIAVHRGVPMTFS